MPTIAAGQRVTASSLSGSYASGSNPNTTVTQAVLTTLGNLAIPANEAVVNSVYELEVEGNYTQATGTGTTLQLGAQIGGNDDANQVVPAGNVAAAGGTGRFWARVRAICITGGSAGTWKTSIVAVVTPNASPGGGAAIADDSSGTTVTGDTTGVLNLNLRAKWGTTTGTPSIRNVIQTSKKIC